MKIILYGGRASGFHDECSDHIKEIWVPVMEDHLIGGRFNLDRYKRFDRITPIDEEDQDHTVFLWSPK